MSPEPAPEDEALERVRRVRRETLALVASAPADGLGRRPGPDRWSAAEVLDHLVLIDDLYARELEALVRRARAGDYFLYRGFADIDASLRFVPKGLLPLFELPAAWLNLFVPRSLRERLFGARWVLAEAPDRTRPRAGRFRDDLVDELRAGPETLGRILRDGSGLELRRVRHYHPLLGTNDLTGLLGFVARHEERHQAQLREALACAS